MEVCKEDICRYLGKSLVRARRLTSDAAVAGTDSGHGYASDINSQAEVDGIAFAEAYYRAARLYNSGAIDPSGDLGKGSATHCYASDIANRLLGWVDSDSTCTLDKN